MDSIYKRILCMFYSIVPFIFTIAITACSPARLNETKNIHRVNPYYSRTDTSELNLPDSIWKKVLPDNVYRIAREKDTELAFSGKYWNYTGIGTYYCAACGNALFKSDSKFRSEERRVGKECRYGWLPDQ